MIKKCTLIMLTVLLASCASNPDNINAAYVSPLKYADYTCPQLAEEMGYISQRTNTLYQSLKKKQRGDNWQMGVGLVLFWPALFALEGGDGPEATEYAQIKGEFEALRVNSVEKNCNIAMRSPDEILQDAKESDDRDATVSSKSADSELSDRLDELEALHREGKISDEEYENARKAALGI